MTSAVIAARLASIRVHTLMSIAPSARPSNGNSKMSGTMHRSWNTRMDTTSRP